MTSVLKYNPASGDETAPVIDWSALEQHAPPAPAPLIDPDLLRLRQHVSDLEVELAQMRGAEAEKCAAARAEGRQDAERAFKRDEEVRLAELRTALAAAVEAAKPSFARLDRLALTMAEIALANVFDEIGPYRDAVTKSIRRQAVAIGSQAVLNVEVSRTDFPDDAALERLAVEIRDTGLNVKASDALATGCARLRLSLGDVELNLPRYWAEVSALLRQFAAAPGEHS